MKLEKGSMSTSVAPWIQLISGRAFDFECMANNVWDPAEIATVLSRTLRFAGHSRWPYTVAQHSVLVARRFSSGRRQMVALVHDAPEVFIGDISAPLKAYLGGANSDLASLEWRIWEWIAGIHGWIPEFISQVEAEDLRALATEARDVMLDPPRAWLELPDPWPQFIEPWHADYARDVWLHTYSEIENSN